MSLQDQLQHELINATFDGYKDIEHSLRSSHGYGTKVFRAGTGIIGIEVDGSSLFAKCRHNDDSLTIIGFE